MNLRAIQAMTLVCTASCVLEDAGAVASLFVIAGVTDLIDREEDWFHWARLAGTAIATGIAIWNSRPQYHMSLKHMKKHYGIDDDEVLPLKSDAMTKTKGGTFESVTVALGN